MIFIQCVIPNKDKSANKWDDKFVEKQLKTMGVIDGLVAVKSGYAVKFGVNEIYEKFKKRMLVDLGDMNDGRKIKFVKAILFELGLIEGDYDIKDMIVLFSLYAANKSNIENVMRSNNTYRYTNHDNDDGDKLSEEVNNRIIECLNQ